MSTNVLPLPETAPIGRISDDAPPAALPTLNPADSPYKPLTLPTVEPKQVPVSEQQPVQNLGATSHAGGLAYLADQVLRGAMKGYDAAQAHKADQFNKKLAAQQAIYNDQAKQLHDMAVAGVDPNSDEFKQAKNRVLTSWQATMQTIGQRIPQPKQSKKSQQGQSSDTDQSNLLQRVMNHKNDPQDALQAVYQGAVSTGPPVFHQIAPYLTPQYQAQKKQGAQTAATAATGQNLAAQNQVSTQQAMADRDEILRIPEDKRTPDQKQKLQSAEDVLTPMAKPSTAVWKEYKHPDGSLGWHDASRPETIPQGSSAVGVGAAGKAPKEGWTKVDGKWGSQLYDPTTNQPIPGTFDTSKAPPSSVLSLFPQQHTFHNFFVDSNGVRQEFISTNTSERSLPPGMGGGEPSATSHQPKTAAPVSGTTPPASGGAKTTPIAYVGSQGYKQAVKQATDAQKEFNGASTNLSTMIKTADEAKKGNGAAQVGILASYLKSVVGGQGTGVRITKAEWDAAANTRPWLKGIEAHFSPDGYLSGAVIAPSQVDQMVQEVHQKTKALYDNVSAAKKRIEDQKKADMDAGGLGATPPPKAAPSSFNWDAHPVAQ